MRLYQRKNLIIMKLNIIMPSLFRNQNLIFPKTLFKKDEKSKDISGSTEDKSLLKEIVENIKYLL